MSSPPSLSLFTEYSLRQFLLDFSGDFIHSLGAVLLIERWRSCNGDEGEVEKDVNIVGRKATSEENPRKQREDEAECERNYGHFKQN